MNSSQNINILKNIQNNQKENRIIFYDKLSDTSSNRYLARIDYTSSPIIFNWENPYNVPVYIFKYTFAYTESSEPTSSQLYHGTTYTAKIGRVDSTNTDFEVPYISIDNNRDHYEQGNSNETKKQWTSDPGWCYEYNFKEAPIKILPGRRFGHYIAGDFSTTSYDSNPIGNIEGYYYNS